MSDSSNYCVWIEHYLLAVIELHYGEECWRIHENWGWSCLFVFEVLIEWNFNSNKKAYNSNETQSEE